MGFKSGTLAFGPSFVLAVSLRACPLNPLKFVFPICKIRKIIMLHCGVSMNKYKHLVKAVFNHFGACGF